MKQTFITLSDLAEAKLRAVASKHAGNLADCRFTPSSYELADNVLCHLQSIDGSVDVYGKLSFLHRLMDIKGWKNSVRNSSSAYWWITTDRSDIEEASRIRR